MKGAILPNKYFLSWLQPASAIHSVTCCSLRHMLALLSFQIQPLPPALREPLSCHSHHPTIPTQLLTCPPFPSLVLQYKYRPISSLSLPDCLVFIHPSCPAFVLLAWFCLSDLLPDPPIDDSLPTETPDWITLPDQTADLVLTLVCYLIQVNMNFYLNLSGCESCFSVHACCFSEPYTFIFDTLCMFCWYYFCSFAFTCFYRVFAQSDIAIATRLF